MSFAKRREIQKENVSLIREQYDWFETAHTLVTGQNKVKLESIFLIN